MKPEPTYNQYKIRKLSWNDYGDIFGITIPREIKEKFADCKFTITCTQTEIILKSGLDLVQFKKEIGKHNLAEFK